MYQILVVSITGLLFSIGGQDRGFAEGISPRNWPRSLILGKRGCLGYNLKGYDATASLTQLAC